jgi:hypothetical protein
MRPGAIGETAAESLMLPRRAKNREGTQHYQTDPDCGRAEVGGCRFVTQQAQV